MNLKSWVFLPLIFIFFKQVKSQDTATDSVGLFLSNDPINLVLNTDMRKLLADKKKGEYQPATISFKLPDSSEVKESIQIKTRGNFRRDYCYIPPLKLDFKNHPSPKLKKLHQLKLVTPCRAGSDYEQYVLKEYLIYKMFNLFTEMSFRVRLININFVDSKGKKKPFESYGFLVEDVDDMAKRNGCKEADIVNLHTESTDRDYMTLTAVFQYMIGNTDWAVPVPHNIKLVTPKKADNAKPFAVPYDFDYSGIVNANYAVPSPDLGILSVRDRLYRGFPRTISELKKVSALFIDNKEKIYSLINDCKSLTPRNKKDMTDYLDEFYRTLSRDADIKTVFIDGARRS